MVLYLRSEHLFYLQDWLIVPLFSGFLPDPKNGWNSKNKVKVEIPKLFYTQKRKSQGTQLVLLILSCIDFIYLFVERGGGREKEREKNMYVREKLLFIAPRTPPTENLACNPSLCPDQEWTGDLSVHRLVLNPESHQPGPILYFSF